MRATCGGSICSRASTRPASSSSAATSSAPWGGGRGGAGGRDALGLPGGGPRYCVTPLAILDFHEETKRLRLRSVHPGVTVEQVLTSTGFPLIVPDHVPVTELPSAAELDILRRRV